MVVETLFEEIKHSHISIEVVQDELHLWPREKITDHIRAHVKALKFELIDFIEEYEERAAIIEHDGKLPKYIAEKSAFQDLTKRRKQYLKV